GNSLNLSVTTNQSVYKLKKHVAISGRLSSGGQPVAGTAVTFTITKPDGTVVSSSLMTKKNGQVSYKYRSTLLDPTGTYWVAAETGTAGASLGGLVTTSFLVQ